MDRKKYSKTVNTITALATSLCLLASLPAKANQTALTTDDVLSLKLPGSPRLSPNGKWIAYTVRHNDMEKDKSLTRIWMTSSNGKTTLPMTEKGKSAGAPQWSPDGKYLAFLAAKGKDAKTQVWLLDMRGGEAQQYTRTEQGVDSFLWSPDSSKMLLIIKDQTEQEKAKTVAKKAGETPEDKPTPWVIDRLQFKADYVGYLDRTRTHIYVKENADAAPAQLTFGDYDDDSPVWSPDGNEIAFVSNRTAEPDGNTNSDIWVVSVTPDDEPAPLRQITTNPGSDYAPAWSRDGKHIAHVSVTDVDKMWYATNHLAISNAAGGDMQILTADLDRNVRNPIFTSGDREILFSLEDSAEQQLAKIKIKSGKIERLVKDGLAIGSFDHHWKNGTALLVSKPDMPAEVFLEKKGKLRQLSNLNTKLINNKSLAAVQNITFPSADGTEIEGFIFTPPGYEKGKRYPTLLHIHGGPVAQYNFGFNIPAQVLSTAGYVVVITNPRGSSGYGQDFSSILFANWGVKDYEDVNAGVDYAIREGFTDPDKLGVGGWSYGGILTNYIIGKTGRFKAAISGASEVNHTANYGHDIYQQAWEAELGLPWENRAAWERINPFNNLGNVTTPTLVMGGKEDWNVPIQNSEQLYQVLKRRGIPTQLVVYPNEHHGIRRPSFVKDRYERYLDWYNSYLKGATVPEAQKAQ